MKYIAILGFAEPCSRKNQKLATDTGRYLAESGFGIAAGNYTSTFMHAFKGAKSAQGKTCAILERKPANNNHLLIDKILLVADQKTKHKKIAQYCSAAIVIGGGNGTLSLVGEFARLNKPVTAIEGSGGVVKNELKENVVLSKDSEESVSHISKMIIDSHFAFHNEKIIS